MSWAHSAWAADADQGHRADRRREPDLGADRSVDRAAARHCRASAAHRPVPGRVSGQCAVSDRGRRDRVSAPQPEHLAEPADGAGHAMVHPVQRHCRRQRLPDRSARGVYALSAALLAMVARGDPARDISLLRHRGIDRVRRLLERQHRCGGCQLGRYQTESRRPRLIHRPGDGGGRLSPGRARHRRHVDLRRRS